MKTDVDRQLLVWKMKKSLILQNYPFFLFSKPKVVYLNTFLSSLQFSKFREQNQMYFWCNHVETESCFSHELVTFINYHMPLIFPRFLIFFRIINIK